MRTHVSCLLLRVPPCPGPERNIRETQLNKAPEPQHVTLREDLQDHLTQGFLTRSVSEVGLSLPLKSDRSDVGTTILIPRRLIHLRSHLWEPLSWPNPLVLLKRKLRLGREATCWRPHRTIPQDYLKIWASRSQSNHGLPDQERVKENGSRRWDCLGN